jgi:ribonuclease D
MTDFFVCDGDLTDDLFQQYMQAPALAIDTETMGLLPWRDRLCLVQICDPQGTVTAIRIHKGQTEAVKLQQLMEASNITKVFHFARFDLAILRQQLNIFVDPVFCTKIASKLARTYTGQHGLKSLIQDLEGIELDKTSQCSDWGNVGNLSEEQLRYAGNDVRYLLSAREKLINMLTREERLDIAMQCFNCLPTMVSLDLLQYHDIFEHK